MDNYTTRIVSSFLYTLFDKKKNNHHYRTNNDIKFDLYRLEEKALYKIKQVFTIPNTVWDNFLTYIFLLKQKNNLLLTQENFSCIHDATIPVVLMNHIKSALIKNAINPNAVSISSLNSHQTELAKSLGFIQDHTAHLYFNIKKMLVLSHQEREYIIVHEIGHLKEFHSSIMYLIDIIQKCDPHLTAESIKKQPDFMHYCKMQELVADLIVSISDKNTAHILFKAIQKMYIRFRYTTAYNYPTPCKLYWWLSNIVYCHNSPSRLL